MQDFRKHRTLSMFMPLLSGTLQLGTLKTPNRRRSCLFCLWVIMCTTLVSYYSGEITGTLVSPIQDDIIKNLQGLRDRNFTLVVFMADVSKFLESIKVSFKSTSSKRALIRFFLDCHKVSTKGDLQTLFLQNNRFSIAPWEYAIYMMRTGDDFNKRLGKSSTEIARRCYIGQELLLHDEEFFVTVPPGNDRLTVIYQQLTQGGISQRFWQEVEDMQTSQRVQDRVRITSRSKIRNEELLGNITLQGKMITVFLLWLVCIILSTLVFANELIFFGQRKYKCWRVTRFKFLHTYK